MSKNREHGETYKKATLDTHNSGADMAIDIDVKCEDTNTNDVLYSIEDVPPWYMALLLGLQHYITMFGGTVAVPLILTPAMCFGDDYVSTSEVIGTIFFVSGLVTLLQTTVGVRLPIVQGGTFSFLAPTFAILSLPKWQCPTEDKRPYNQTLTTSVDNSEIWQPRMREVQGAIMVASLFQVLIGCSGLIGLILRFIGPITIAATISLVGLGLFETGASISGEHWWIAIMTIVLITLFSQYLRNLDIPMFYYHRRRRKCDKTLFPLFKVFPVILAIATSWLICYILTATDVLTSDPDEWGYLARTDLKLHVLHDASWFRVPYPGQWGMPTVSVAAVFGMLSGVLGSMVESIGDYYAAARLSNAPPPPIHAINRGVFMEGVGCIMAGLWGTGNGTTSYSENIGAIGITKVASRRVVVMAAVLMMFFGVFGKFGAFFVTIPHPILGGMFLVMFGTVFAVGVSNLQFVELNSGRNLFIYGFSVILGLSLPKWLADHPGAIATGSSSADQILTVLCSTCMFVGGVTAAVLDNTVPGTLQERGIIAWQQQYQQEASEGEGQGVGVDTYDLPVGMGCIQRYRWWSYVPLCPTYTGVGCCKERQDADGGDSDGGGGCIQQQQDVHKSLISEQVEVEKSCDV